MSPAGAASPAGGAKAPRRVGESPATALASRAPRWRRVVVASGERRTSAQRRGEVVDQVLRRREPDREAHQPVGDVLAAPDLGREPGV